MTIEFTEPITLVIENRFDPSDEYHRLFGKGATAELAGIDEGDGTSDWVDLCFSREWRACGVHRSAFTIIS